MAPYSIAGFLPQINGSTLIVEPFSYFAWGPYTGQPTGMAGQDVVNADTLTIDLTTVGMNGCDVNPNPGSLPPDGARDLHMFYNPTTGKTAGVVSLFGSTNYVARDPAFTFYRKMMCGVIVKNGIIQPCTTVDRFTWFTGRESDLIVKEIDASTGGWSSAIDVSGLMPENSDFGFWRANIISPSGNGRASVWISPSNVIPNPFWKSLANAPQIGTTCSLAMRTTSDRLLYTDVAIVGDAIVQLIRDGYGNVEQS